MDFPKELKIHSVEGWTPVPFKLWLEYLPKRREEDEEALRIPKLSDLLLTLKSLQRMEVLPLLPLLEQRFRLRLLEVLPPRL